MQCILSSGRRGRMPQTDRGGEYFSLTQCKDKLRFQALWPCARDETGYEFGLMKTLTIRQPDDWHLHLRDGIVLEAVAPHTAHFGSAKIERASCRDRALIPGLAG